MFSTVPRGTSGLCRKTNDFYFGTAVRLKHLELAALCARMGPAVGKGQPHPEGDQETKRTQPFGSASVLPRDVCQC